MSISGATEKTFVITNPEVPDIRDIASQDDYQYRCVITNEDGTVTSNFATTSLASGSYSTNPYFTVHPQSQTVAEGTDLILECRWCTSASAAIWKRDPAGPGNFANVTDNGTTILIESGFLAPIGTVPGYYFSKLTIKGILEAQNGDIYKLNVVNPAGNTDSNAATITVIEPASEDISGNVTAGSTFTINKRGSSIRDVLPNETVGVSLKLVGNTLVRHPDFTGNHQNIRGQTTDTYITGSESVVIAGTVTHPPFMVQVLGGTPPYKFVWHRANSTAGIVINKVGGYDPDGWVSGSVIIVEELPTSLEVGDIIKWSVTPDTATFTVTTAASAGDEKIYGNLVVDNDTTLPNEKSSYLYWNTALDETISAFTDATCDTTFHTEASCVTTTGSDTITCSANDSIEVGQYVSGDGITSDSTVLTINGSQVTSFTISNNVKVGVTSPDTVELTFATKTVTCDSNSDTAVGQDVSGTGVSVGTTVATVNSAGSVTSFTISEPAAAAVTNTELTFRSQNSRYYDVGYSTTAESLKGTAKDTSELSFIVAKIDGVDGSFDVGRNSIFRCVATDAAGVERTSGMFWIEIFTGGL